MPFVQVGRVLNDIICWPRISPDRIAKINENIVLNVKLIGAAKRPIKINQICMPYVQVGPISLTPANYPKLHFARNRDICICAVFPK